MRITRAAGEGGGGGNGIKRVLAFVCVVLRLMMTSWPEESEAGRSPYYQLNVFSLPKEGGAQQGPYIYFDYQLFYIYLFIYFFKSLSRGGFCLSLFLFLIC